MFNRALQIKVALKEWYQCLRPDLLRAPRILRGTYTKRDLKEKEYI